MSRLPRFLFGILICIGLTSGGDTFGAKEDTSNYTTEEKICGVRTRGDQEDIYESLVNRCIQTDNRDQTEDDFSDFKHIKDNLWRETIEAKKKIYIWTFTDLYCDDDEKLVNGFCQKQKTKKTKSGKPQKAKTQKTIPVEKSGQDKFIDDCTSDKGVLDTANTSCTLTDEENLDIDGINKVIDDRNKKSEEKCDTLTYSGARNWSSTCTYQPGNFSGKWLIHIPNIKCTTGTFNADTGNCDSEPVVAEPQAPEKPVAQESDEYQIRTIYDQKDMYTFHDDALKRAKPNDSNCQVKGDTVECTNEQQRIKYVFPFGKIYPTKADYEKANAEECKATCQGANKKCETSNQTDWFCIDLADGEYEKEDDCTTACTDGKCEYTRITNKAKIPYHAFVCKSKEQTAEQEELKAKIEPDAKRIIDAYNTRKAALEAENSK